MFIQTIHPKQNATQSQYLNRLLQVWIERFSFFLTCSHICVKDPTLPYLLRMAVCVSLRDNDFEKSTGLLYIQI